MQPLITVLVPVYKVEKYLPRCLDSLCRQSLKDIEILLIDDASPDRCGEICDAYAAKDARFLVIHNKKNQGLSVARNIGIEHATADYLMFVDSDDWVHEDFCKIAYECALQNDVDLVMFGYQEINNTPIRNNQKETVETVTTGFKTREEAINLTFKAYGTVAWNKLYRKKLFEDICYPEGQLYEDTATSYKLIWKATTIYCIDKVLYYYFRHNDSIMNRNRTRKILQEQFKVCWQECCDLSKWGFQSEEYELYKTNLALIYCIHTPLNFSDYCYSVSAEVLQGIKKTPQGFTRKRKYLLKLFKWSPKLFDLVCLICAIIHKCY